MAGEAPQARSGRPGAGGVVLHGDRVLLLYKRLNGEWRLPKGRLDEGEDTITAAVREVSEETGFTQLEVVRLLGTRQLEYAAAGQLTRRQLTFYRMHLSGFGRCPRNKRDARRFAVRWLPVDQALATLTFDDERQWLRQALETA